MTFKEQLIITIVDKLFIGILILLAGLWVSQSLELFKLFENRRAQSITVKVNIIDKQLADFYWPITFRLEKDNAVWKKLMDSDKEFARQIESEVILPNHKEITGIIDSHSDLIFNAWEPIESKFIEKVKLYQRHVAVYSALRSMGDSRMPIDLNEPWPDMLHASFIERINDLQKQRSKLLGE